MCISLYFKCLKRIKFWLAFLLKYAIALKLQYYYVYSAIKDFRDNWKKSKLNKNKTYGTYVARCCALWIINSLYFSLCAFIFFLIYRLLYIIIILEQNSVRIFYRGRIIKVMQQLSQLKLFCFTWFSKLLL